MQERLPYSQSVLFRMSFCELECGETARENDPIVPFLCVEAGSIAVRVSGGRCPGRRQDGNNDVVVYNRDAPLADAKAHRGLGVRSDIYLPIYHENKHSTPLLPSFIIHPHRPNGCHHGVS